MNVLGSEIIELMRDNPDLPIVAMVGYEVCQGDDYAFWYASSSKAAVKHVLECCSIDDERLFIREDDDEDMVDRVYDDPARYIDGVFTRVGGDGDENELFWESTGLPITAEESVKLAEEYVANLPWQKCIVLYLDV